MFEKTRIIVNTILDTEASHNFPAAQRHRPSRYSKSPLLILISLGGDVEYRQRKVQELKIGHGMGDIGPAGFK